MPFHLDSPWGATLMPLRACAMDWRRNRMLRVSKNYNPVLSCRPQSMKFWDKVGDVLYFSTPLSDCLCRISIRRYSPLSFEIAQKRPNVQFIGPNFWKGRPQLFHGYFTADCYSLFTPSTGTRVDKTVLSCLVRVGAVWTSY